MTQKSIGQICCKKAKSNKTTVLSVTDHNTIHGVNKYLDKIIPTKSQVAFWKVEPNLKGGHCPFFQFKKWSELL